MSIQECYTMRRMFHEIYVARGKKYAYQKIKTKKNKKRENQILDDN